MSETNIINNKKGQKQKSKILASMPKMAQEEMVGFAMIIIIVAIILLVLLGISLSKPETHGVESYEVESFIQAILQQTTECSSDYGNSYNDIRSLITECYDEQICENGNSACSILNSILNDILDKSWQAGQDSPVKGYELNITSKGNSILTLSKGNMTANYKGSVVDMVKKGVAYNTEFRVYY